MFDDTFQNYNGELDGENEVYNFKEKAEIIISDPSRKQEIHDWLCTEGLGCGCLTRSVECKNFHKMLPNILEMDLKENEIELFNSTWAGVAQATFQKVALYTDFQFQKVNLTNNNKGTVFGQNFPTNTNSNYLSGDFIPHPSLFTQDPFVPQDNSFTNDKNLNLSSIDCSNVDVVVLDSGVNKEHPDLSASVIDFDWTQLRDGEDGITGDRIFTETSLPSNYYDDSNGHGTACASLIAGKRCGMAQGAKIYALATKELGNEGFEDIAECMAGCVAFLKAKKNNNLGLNSERPTIFSNSWGSLASFGRFFDNTLLPSLSYTPYTGFLSASDGIDLPIGIYNSGDFSYLRNTKVSPLSNVSDIRLLSAGLIENEVAHITDENFTNPWAFRANSGDYNHGTDSVNLTRGPYHGNTEGKYFYGTQVASINAYVDQILELGGHFLVAAGNFNEYINHNHSLEVRRNENTGAGGSPYGPRFASFDYINYRAWREGVDGNNEVLSGNPTFINTSLSSKRYSSPSLGSHGVSRLAFTQSISGLFNCQSNHMLDSTIEKFGYSRIFRSWGSMFTLKEECGVTSPILDVSRANNTNQAWVSGHISARCGYNDNTEFNFPQIPFNEAYIDVLDDSKSKLALSFYNHSSPFKSFNKWYSSDWNDYPAISVGDVTPVGNYNVVNNFFQSDAQSLLTYAALSSITNDVSQDPRFITGSNTKYKELSNVRFVKTSYTTYGEDVDVYAPGNAAWAAKSANSSTSAPVFRAGTNNEYRFFNGTSSACPIAAGCLATFLAAHPKTTNVAAKRWLIDNSLQGFILETKKYSHIQENVAQLKTSLSSFTELAYDLGALSANGNGEYPYAGEHFAPPPLSATLDFTGTLSTFNSFLPEDMTGSYSQRVALSSCAFLTNINIGNPENEGFTMSNFLSSNLGYGYGNNTIFLNEPNKERIKRSILLNHSFFGSNNRVVQAYPIRKAVFDKLRTNKVIFNGSLLNFEKPTSETPTHFGI